MSIEQQFRDAFRGRFSSVLRWHQLDELWNTLRVDAASDWYIYAVGTPPPDAPVSVTEMEKFIEEVDVLLRADHQEDYCGIVYADDFSSPAFVKIFDPNNLGVSCGFSDNPPLPGWILSKLPPADLHADMPLPGNRKRWWQRIFPAHAQ